MTSVSKQLFYSFAIPLTIAGFGVFGLPIAIIFLLATAFSSSFRDWFVQTPGYQNRLSKFPFFKSPSRNGLLLGFACFFLLPVLICSSLVGALAYSQLYTNAFALLMLPVPGLVGATFLYYWLIEDTDFLGDTSVESGG